MGYPETLAFPAILASKEFGVFLESLVFKDPKDRKETHTSQL